MKKLVFCILFIIVIVGSLAIPTFAEDPIPYQIPLTNLIVSDSSLRGNPPFQSQTRSLGSISLIGLSASYSGLYVTALEGAQANHSYIISFDISSSVPVQNWLSFYSTHYVLDLVQYRFWSNTETQRFVFSFTLPETITWCIIQTGTNNTVDIEYSNFNIFDVTDTGYTVEQLNQYGVFDSTFQGQFARIPGFFNPLIDFYLSFFHIFDWIPEIISTYSAPFVFCVISLSVLLIVFIIVCIIRRCRSS